LNLVTDDAKPNQIRNSEAFAGFDLSFISIKTLSQKFTAYSSCLSGYKLENIAKAWKKVFMWCSARELINADSVMIGLSFDDPEITVPDKCRYYACISINEGIEDRNGIFASLSAAGIPVGTEEGMTSPVETGFQHWMLVRLILDECRTVDEAVKLAEKLPLCTNANILVAEKMGIASVLEISGSDFTTSSYDRSISFLISSSGSFLSQLIVFQCF